MNREVVSIRPDMPLFEAHAIITSHNFDGAPVVDSDNRLVGILTEYDMLVKGSALHLPTFQKVLTNLRLGRKEEDHLRADMEELRKLTVRDVMNPDPLTLPETASFEDVVKTFREHHRVNPIPVIDQERRVVGVVSRFDVLKPIQYVGSQ